MIEKRTDRRKKPTPFLCQHTFFGRRSENRRSEDQKGNSYFDRYGSKVWILCLSLLCLNIFDALMTLYHLRFGATESNPLLDYFLQTGGEEAFLLAKFGLAFSGIFFLFLHSNFKRVKLYTSSLVAVYGVLAFYHVSPFFVDYTQLS